MMEQEVDAAVTSAYSPSASSGMSDAVFFSPGPASNMAPSSGGSGAAFFGDDDSASGDDAALGLGGSLVKDGRFAAEQAPSSGQQQHAGTPRGAVFAAAQALSADVDTVVLDMNAAAAPPPPKTPPPPLR